VQPFTRPVLLSKLFTEGTDLGLEYHSTMFVEGAKGREAILTP